MHFLNKMGCMSSNAAPEFTEPSECPEDSEKPRKRAEEKPQFRLKPVSSIRQLKGPLECEYKVLKTVSDSRGKLLYAEYLHTCQPCVIRAVSKTLARDVGLKKLRNELQVLSKLDHPHILKTYETLEDSSHFYIVFEGYVKGQFERFSKKSLPEETVAHILHQVLCALCYCHIHGIAHRNIRLENIVLQDESEEYPVVKLTGFTEAVFVTKNTGMNTAVGSCYFIAPEVLKRYYTEKCDLWSCGILAYYLLSGRFPYCGTTPELIVSEVINSEVSYPDETWAGISPIARDFVTFLLQPDPDTRPSALIALSHPLLAFFQPTAANGSIRKSLRTMLGIRAQAALKSAVMTFIVNRIVDRKELTALRQAFQALDLNGDGQLSEAELRTGLGKLLPASQADSEAKRVMKLADGNQNGVLDYSEFIISAYPEERLLDVSNLKMAFDSFDRDSSGRISLEELKETVMVCGGEEDSAVWEELVRQIDRSGDGEVDFDEFTHMMKSALA